MDVVQNGTPNLTIKVNPGSGMIREGTFPGDIAYHVVVDTSGGYSVSFSGLPDASNPRNCYVVAYVDKAATPSGTNNTNVFKIIAVGGTPSGSPADPTTGQIQASAVGATNPYYVLGRVRLGAAATTISTGMIDDLRAMASIQGANIANYKIVRQNNTTNSTETSARFLSGWGVMAYNTGTTFVSESVTFDTAFTSAPIVTISFGGDHASLQTYGSGGNLVEAVVSTKPVNISTTGFTVYMHKPSGGNFSAGYGFYQWFAVGV